MKYEIFLFTYSFPYKLITKLHFVPVLIDHTKRYGTVMVGEQISNYKWKIKRSNYRHIVTDKGGLIALSYED